jgi:hypothetical protein
MPAIPYKIFMIYLPGNEASEYYAKKTIRSWKNMGYDVIPFEGSTPETLGTEIPFSIKDNGGAGSVVRPFTETEKAIYYSSYRLWQLCVELDEPIIVIEHDSMLIEDFNHDIFRRVDSAILSCKPRMYGFSKPEIDWVPTAGSGYFMRPNVAKLAADMEFWKDEINCNSDGHIVRSMITALPNPKAQRIYIHPHIRHYYNPKIGSTIDHKHEWMKIVK